MTPSEAEEDATTADRLAHSAKIVHNADVMRRNALGETKLHQAAISVGVELLILSSKVKFSLCVLVCYTRDVLILFVLVLMLVDIHTPTTTQDGKSCSTASW